LSNIPQSVIPEFKQSPGVVFSPYVQHKFQKGVHKIVNAILPTLGPIPRTVAIERYPSTRSPELLDSGGIIARRIIDLPDQDENIGAMYIRGALWNLHDRVGDGTATAAVIFQTIYDEGLKYISAGGNAMLLRTQLEQGMEAILSQLSAMTSPVETQEVLTSVARSICYDAELAELLGDIFHLVGGYGFVDIRSGRHRESERQYIEGSYWPGGLASKSLITDHLSQQTRFEEAAILITDMEIEEPGDLSPVLQHAVDNQIMSLFIMAKKFSEKVLGMITQSQKSEKLHLTAVKSPGMRADFRMDAMTDMAVLTGGQLIIEAAGDTLRGVTSKNFGYVRQVWADMDYVGISGGKGDPREIRKHVAHLRSAHANAKKSTDQKMLLERIGRLLGGSAMLEVGGLTESEMNTRKALAVRTADALRGAVREGVLPGGGVALLDCRTVIHQRLKTSNDDEERAANRILLKALEAPFRAIVENSGYHPGATLAKIVNADPGYGFDVVEGCVVDMLGEGILDVASVVYAAVHNAIRSAGFALTIDTVVHRKKPPAVTEPDAPGL